MDCNGEIRETLGDNEEEECNEPFIVEVVAKAETSREVGNRGEGNGESEGLVLEDVWFGVRGYGFENLEVEVVEFGGGGGGGSGGSV